MGGAGLFTGRILRVIPLVIGAVSSYRRADDAGRGLLDSGRAPDLGLRRNDQRLAGPLSLRRSHSDQLSWPCGRQGRFHRLGPVLTALAAAGWNAECLFYDLSIQSYERCIPTRNNDIHENHHCQAETNEKTTKGLRRNPAEHPLACNARISLAPGGHRPLKRD